MRCSIARLLRPSLAADVRRLATAGLVLGLTLGLTYLARQEVVWIGLTLLLLAIPAIRRVEGHRVRATTWLLGPVVVGGLVLVLPWLVRQQLTFGGSAAGQVVDNLLLVRNEQIFALHDAPTLEAFLAQGLGGILANIGRAGVTQLTDTIVLGAFPVGIVGIVALVGLRRRPSLAHVLGARGAAPVGCHHLHRHRAAVPRGDVVGHLPARAPARCSWASS